MKEDASQILAVAAYIEHTHHVHKSLIKKEHFIGMTENGKVYWVSHIAGQDILGRIIIRQPDIIILDEKKKRIRLVIEIDGKHHYMGLRRKKTALRNNQYRNARIPYTVINIQRFKETGITWFEHIDTIMGKYK